MSFRLYPDHTESFQGIHRSGWEYALNVLTKSDMFTDNPNAIIFDSYIDRTFHMQELRHLVPYESPWVGCVHHTFDTTHSISNNVTLMNNKDFKKSLKKCLGLFVFSKEQKKLWDDALWKADYYDIEVSVVTHPTELVSKDKMFNPQLFVDNPQRSLVQIGAWLRDAFAIYRLPNLTLKKGKDKLKVYKQALKGKSMDSYFVPIKFMGWLGQSIDNYWGYGKYGSTVVSECGVFKNRSDVSAVRSGNSLSGKPQLEDAELSHGNIMCRNSTRNQFLHYLVEHVEHLLEDVNVIGYLNDDDYDELLTKNVVFLRLVDATCAVNTIMECLVRRTPFFVNRGLPAIEDLVGKEYPLYYDSVYDIPDMLTLSNIEHGYKYLKDFDTNVLSEQAFVGSIKNSSIFSKIQGL